MSWGESPHRQTNALGVDREGWRYWVLQVKGRRSLERGRGEVVGGRKR